MEVSRIIFKKETKEAMEKDLSVRQKGKLLFARLQELDNDGTLSKAKNRADVATMVGYTDERAKAGYSWVSNLISRGNLRETILEWTSRGRIIAEYHVVKSPNYDHQETKRRKDSKKKRAEQVARELINWQKQTPILAEEKPATNSIKIEITRGDMTIKVEMNNHEEASKLITTIMKGE